MTHFLMLQLTLWCPTDRSTRNIPWW